MYKHFNALSGIHIFAGIANSAVGGYMVPAGRPFWLTSFYPYGRDPFYCFLGGGHTQAHTSAPHWIHAWVSPNKQMAIEKQVHTIYGQDKGPIFSLLCCRRVYTPSTILLKSVNSEAPAFLCTIYKGFRIVGTQTAHARS